MSEDRKSYIIPINYKESSKLFGIIKYNVLFEILSFSAILILILRFLPLDIILKIYIFMFFDIPFIVFSMNAFEREGIVNFLICLYKFTKGKKVYIFQKVKHIY